MTTLLAVYEGGRCVRRCDARCYGARGSHCECCCGGANHGAGRSRAIENALRSGAGRSGAVSTSAELAGIQLRLDWIRGGADGDSDRPRPRVGG